MFTITYEKVSKQRTAIMGLAIILIMITHNTFTYQNPVNDWVRMWCDGGGGLLPVGFGIWVLLCLKEVYIEAILYQKIA